ncbi:MAG: serine/threonine protein kinase [Candidatus Riflebacteria bacterium]|nr:serine/threonine protein kinase [Candidatus Riflebacteria bacterium]
MDTIRCPRCGSSVALLSRATSMGTCHACDSVVVAEGAAEVTLLTRGESGEPRATSVLPLSVAFRNRYRLERLLGSGAAGTVFLATHVPTGQSRAVKFLTRVENRTVLARFVTEGRLLAELQHPNVLRLFDVDEIEAHPFMATEYLEGGTLRQRMGHGRMPLAEAVQVTLDCLAGLEACHGRGIVHRDVKPENVLFTVTRAAKLADFGVAKVLDTGQDLTRTGALIGTPMYMSPEQVRGEPAGQPADLYATGAVLYEMLAARPAVHATSLPQLLAMHLESRPRPLREIVPSVPEPVAAVVECALSKDPSRRPPSAAAFAESLRQAFQRSRFAGRARPDGQRPFTISAPPASPAGRAGLWRLAVPAAALLALCATLLTRSAWPPPPRPDATVAASPRPAASPAPRAAPPEVEESRRLRDRVESREAGLEAWFPGKGRPEVVCPLVVFCRDHLKQVTIHAGGQGVIVGLNDRALPGQQTLALGSSSPGLRDGLNWVRIRGGPTGPRQGHVRFLRDPCRFDIRRVEAPPPDFVVTDRLLVDLFVNALDFDHQAASRRMRASLPGGSESLRLALEGLVGLRSQLAGSILADIQEMVGDPLGAYREGDVRCARVCLDGVQSALEADPSRWAPWHLLGETLVRLGHQEAGSSAVARALMTYPEAYWSWVEMFWASWQALDVHRISGPGRSPVIDEHMRQTLRYQEIVALVVERVPNAQGQNLKAFLAYLQRNRKAVIQNRRPPRKER